MRTKKEIQMKKFLNKILYFLKKFQQKWEQKKKTRIKACKRRKHVKDCCFKLPQKKIHTHIYYYHKNSKPNIEKKTTPNKAL